MEKRSKAKAQPSERKPYTVTWTYPTAQQGGATGRRLKVYASDKAEARAKVEADLREKGTTWESITVVEGWDPGLTWKVGTERYCAELKALLGYFWSDTKPRLISSDPGTMPDPDAFAREGWAKFMEDSSSGLVVSDFPRFISCGVHGYDTLLLSPDAVRDPERWASITSAVRQQLDYWKSTLQERIERLGKVKRRSAEDADELKRDKATLKDLEAFDGWSYQAFVGAMLPGREPRPLDLDNPRLYHLSTGKRIPIGLGPDQLREDFWRRLLSLWDGPPNKRAELVREFVERHHHASRGGHAEAFRDLITDTVVRLRSLVSKAASQGPYFVHTASLRNAGRWGVLADKLEGWLKLNARGSSEKGTTLRPLKVIALLHALRFSWDPSAAITRDNDSAIAARAGYTQLSSGRQLREHFTKYAYGSNSHAERLDDGQLHTVLSRYAEVIELLQDDSRTLELAQRERAELRDRE